MFESRFNDQLHRFKSLWRKDVLSESVSGLFLLNSSQVDNAQRISIMAAASPALPAFTSRSSTEEFIEAVSYKSVASVILLCDAPTYIAHSATLPSDPNSPAATEAFKPASSRQGHSCQHNCPQRPKPKGCQGPRNADQFRAAKNRFACVRCDQYIYWYAENNDDGSLRADVIARAVPVVYGATDAAPRRQPRASVAAPAVADADAAAEAPFNALALDMEQFIDAFRNVDPIVQSPLPQVGTMLENGAPYSAIG